MRMEIDYGKLIFIPENKINISLENNLDITIEDKHYKINKISTKMPIICFHAWYNKNCDWNNIIRYYSCMTYIQSQII